MNTSEKAKLAAIYKKLENMPLTAELEGYSGVLEEIEEFFQVSDGYHFTVEQAISLYEAMTGYQSLGVDDNGTEITRPNSPECWYLVQSMDAHISTSRMWGERLTKHKGNTEKLAAIYQALADACREGR